MALNERRAENNRMDCLPCVKVESKKTPDSVGPHHEAFLSRIIEKYYGPFILKTPTQIAVLVFTLAMMAASIYGSMKIESGLSQTEVLGDDSYIIDFVEFEDKYFKKFGVEANIVFKAFDYSDPDNQDGMLELCKAYEESGLVEGKVVSWLHEYLDWLQHSYHNTSLTAKGRPPSEYYFYLWLYEYLANPTIGLKHVANIIFQYGSIKTSRVTLKHRLLTTDFERADVVSGMYSIAKKSKVPAFAFSFHYLYWEQFVNMIRSNVINLSFVAVSIFVIVLLFLGDWFTSFIVMVAVVIIDIDLLGMMYFWGVGLSNVSLVNLLLSLGLAVDACAHVTHSFNIAAHKTHNSKSAVIEGLATIGASVFSGIFTSFLGILALGFAKHEILRIFFKFFFSIFLFALFHGLCVVPIILSHLKM